MLNRKSIRKILIAPFLALIYLYKWVISPVLPGACRHYPTCSEYAVHALKYHGIFRGGLLSANRIIRCNPWGTSGYDPVPKILIKSFKPNRYSTKIKLRNIPKSDLLSDKPLDE